MQRQEARRERRLKTFRRAEKEPKAETRYTVVLRTDARIPKYLYSEAADGFTRQHAEDLAAPVDGQEAKYAVVPLEVHRFARKMGEPLTPAAATTEFLQSEGQA